MSRPTVFDRVDAETVRKLCRRESWPVAMLADLLGCGRRTLYDYLARGTLRRGENGIRTDSVVKMLE